MKLTVVQLGARMHYAVPRILHAAGRLERFVTDISSRQSWPRLLRLLPPAARPSVVRKLLARDPATLPTSKVVTVPMVGVRYQWRLRRATGKPADVATAHLSAGRELGRAAVRRGLAGDGVYAFNSAALDVFREARRRGIRTVYEQTIAPVRSEWGLLREEFARWPNWEGVGDIDAFYRPFVDVESEEWELADRIVCGSAFVRDELAHCSGPVGRCDVVPYGVDLPASPAPRDRPAGRPLRVLTVGTVGLRKGAPYVARAAELCRGRAEFRWVGPVGLSASGAAELGRHVTLTGAVPRSEMTAQYQWADVFLLPSVCEGSATVTYEALAHGLPLVVTPNTGSPHGLVAAAESVPVRDAEAAAAAVCRLQDDQDHWQRQTRLAGVVREHLTVEAYGRRLLTSIDAATSAK